MGEVGWASILASGMAAAVVGTLLQSRSNNAATLLLAHRANNFTTKFKPRPAAAAVAILLVLTISVGCGMPASTNSFSASPAVSGSTSGSSTGTSNTGSGSGTGTGTGSGTGTGTGSTGTGTGSTGTPKATAVQSLSVASSSIAAGTSTTATVTLNAAAPTGGAVVTLTSSNTSAATVPANLSVFDGQASGSFTVKAGTISADESVTITAAYNNTLAGATISVKAPVAPPPPPPPPSGTVTMTLSPSGVGLVSGATQQFTATVSGTTNTAVIWTANFGTVTSSGLFTAPNVSGTTIVTVSAKSQADPTVVKSAYVTVTPPPSGGSTFSGTGPVASWEAFQYLDRDGVYHQALAISHSQSLYPVIGYSSPDPGCTNIHDTFNDFWQPIGNGLWWFINFPDYVYVKWVWYDNVTNRNILQQTPCIDYSAAPKYN